MRPNLGPELLAKFFGILLVLSLGCLDRFVSFSGFLPDRISQILVFLPDSFILFVHRPLLEFKDVLHFKVVPHYLLGVNFFFVELLQYLIIFLDQRHVAATHLLLELTFFVLESLHNGLVISLLFFNLFSEDFDLFLGFVHFIVWHVDCPKDVRFLGLSIS